jgi:hypothetical protein
MPEQTLLVIVNEMHKEQTLNQMDQQLWMEEIHREKVVRLNN